MVFLEELIGSKMFEKIEEVDLDLRVEKFEVFQRFVETLTISAMHELLDAGMEPPRTDVVRGSDGIYRLLHAHGDDRGANYGGHHRYFSRFTWRDGTTPLPRDLYSEHMSDPHSTSAYWMSPDQIQLLDRDFSFRFFNSVKYLPEGNFGSFCERERFDMERFYSRCRECTGQSFDELRSGALEGVV